MKKHKIPKGYESMQTHWNIDPKRSVLELAFACPEGWEFFEWVRKDTEVTITYIRSIQHETVQSV